MFLRIRTPVELGICDEFIVGDQLVRVSKTRSRTSSPGPGSDVLLFVADVALVVPRSSRSTRGIAKGACVVARGTTVIVGRSVADLVFASDPLVDEQHCIVEEQANVIVLTDLGSRTGVFVRVKGEHELAHGDELLVGRTRLMVDLNAG